ncbi:hypothetical protein GXY_01538 [Novacetimonas hansenii ATCC 23769]|uniref:Uncharacterized protein n=1 Tax=Novacetimonas hansenii ATCC 23769 TaxID=714995 RepID=D5QAK5_NOVHA|nr:hypothetical protein GXY_01538 [Novacetimonas hansenii ATCC 23769]
MVAMRMPADAAAGDATGDMEGLYPVTGACAGVDHGTCGC